MWYDLAAMNQGPAIPDHRPSWDLRSAADELFASSTLVDLLLLFCANPEQRFYVNEMIKRTGRFPRSIQLALAKLEAAGLVQSERQANAKFYRIVAGHPFYPELRTLCTRILDVGEALRARLGRIAGIRVAFVRREEGETGSADLDLVVIGEGGREEIEATVAELGRRLGRPIHLDFFPIEEWDRQRRRERSYARWLLTERRVVVLGDEAFLSD